MKYRLKKEYHVPAMRTCNCSLDQFDKIDETPKFDLNLLKNELEKYGKTVIEVSKPMGRMGNNSYECGSCLVYDEIDFRNMVILSGINTVLLYKAVIQRRLGIDEKFEKIVNIGEPDDEFYTVFHVRYSLVNTF